MREIERVDKRRPEVGVNLVEQGREPCLDRVDAFMNERVFRDGVAIC